MKNINNENSNLPIAVNINDNYGDIHCHDELEIIFILRGCGELLVNSVDYKLKKGDIRIINIDNVHRIKSDDPDFKYLSMFFHMPYFNQFIPNIEYVFFACEPNEKIRGGQGNHISNLTNAYFNIINYFFEDENDDPDLNVGYLNEKSVLLLNELRNWFTLKHFQFEKNYSVEQFERIWIIMDYIYDNCHRKLTIEEIADNVYLTPNYLSHYIKKVSGSNFQSLLNFIRSENALKMLIGTDKSITRISMECGFSEPRYFKKYFEKYYGVSPQDYRNQYGQNRLEKTHALFKTISFEHCSGEDLEMIKKNIIKYTKPVKNSNVYRNVERIYVDLNTSDPEPVIKDEIVYLNCFEDLYSPKNQNMLEESINKLGISRIVLNADKKINKKENVLINDIARKLNCLLSVEPVKSYRNKTMLLCDEKNKKNGLFTIRGEKTPYFYYKQFNSMLKDPILKRIDNLLVSGNEAFTQIIVDNYFSGSKGNTKNKDIIVGLKGLEKSEYLRVDYTVNNCSDFYKELDRRQLVYDALSEVEAEMMNGGGQLDVFYETMTLNSKIYEMNVNQSPDSIKLILFKRFSN